MLLDHLEKLKHFVGVVRANSIRGYAVQHHISQPAVSKSIQILESVLEVGLLVRDTHGVQLSTSGKILYEWAEKILQEGESIEERIRRSVNVRLSGTLTLGTYQSIAVYFLPHLFKFLSKTQENLHLNFLTGTSQELVKKLKSGEVDLIISIDPPEEKGLFHKVLFEDNYSLYRSTRGTRKLGSSPIFSLPAAKGKNGITVNQLLKSARMADYLVTCGDFEAAKAMMDADAGLAFLPARVAKPLVDLKRAEKITNAKLLSNVGDHSVVFSTKSHRADDISIKWISQQIELMLRVD
jgi:DNA-binding transcriptional LysR family regulator